MIKNFIILIPLLFLSSLSCCYAAQPDFSAEMEKMRELRRDISLLNLVNGFYLSNDQMESLLDVLYKVEALEEKYKERALAALQKWRHLTRHLKPTCLMMT